MGRLLNENSAVRYPRVYGRRDDDGSVIVTFTFTQSVEIDAAKIAELTRYFPLTDRQIIEMAREMVASQYDGDLVDGAYLLLGDADVDLENMRGE